jgi:hypothetical protein
MAIGTDLWAIKPFLIVQTLPQTIYLLNSLIVEKIILQVIDGKISRIDLTK